MDKKRWRMAAGALTLALIVSLGLGIRWYGEGTRLRRQLNEIYQGQVLSALGQLEDMQLSLSKALLSGEQGAVWQYLHQAGDGAAQVQRSLSILPLSHTATQHAVKFANQLSDYTASLMGNALTETDAEQLERLTAACLQSAQALWQARQQLTDQCLKGTAAFYPLGDTQPAYDNGVSYPTMIYDGPFSDARQQGAAAALGEREITREEAHQAAREFVGAERVIGVSQGADMGGAIPCYGVTVQLSDITLECAVTKRGGKVLWMAPDTADFAQRLSLEECRENALSFLESRGYGPMESTHFQVYQGMVVVAFAPLQGNTLLYPDQVKVQLRGDTGQVVGIEARSYWENHGHRGVFSPRLTQEEAQGAVSSRMQVKSCRLCLIPKHQQEILCYEFRGEYKGEDYLVYIHADTGEQEELLKVVESETGLEAV